MGAAGDEIDGKNGDLMNKNDFRKKRANIARRPVGELIELLYGKDLETRFFAEMALRDASGA
jgi:hypothetical protein